MKKILPILLIVIGIAGGGAAGMFLKPAPEPDTAEQDGDGNKAMKAKGKSGTDSAQADYADEPANPEEPRTYVKVGRQTIVPIVEGGETTALMLFELAVDVPPGKGDRVVNMEPRLRDAFLRELLKMSHTGAFGSNFTDDAIIEELRRNLVNAATKHLGDLVQDVLILDIMRQEK